MKIFKKKPKVEVEKPGPEDETGLKLELEPSEILHKKSVECEVLHGNWPLAANLGKKMIEWVLAYNSAPNRKMRGVGLAAPQIGFNLRLFVMIPRAKIQGGWTSTICINPKILDHGRGEKIEVEGCLSVPGDIHRVKRWEVLNVQYFDENGKLISRTLKYWEARIFQHEMDHLEGVLCHQKPVS